MTSSDNQDAFFLNFGSSNNVCDELRHSIRQEVTEIDASISKVEEEKHKEDRTNNELNKSLSHCRKEMFNLRRFASDIHNSATMNETLRVRMMEDLAGELVNPYLKGKDGDVSINDGADHLTSSPTSTVFLEERQEEINLFMAITTKSKTDTMNNHTKNQELMEAKAAALHLIATEELQDKLTLGENELEDLDKSFENEQRRVRITKEALHHARTKSGMHAQEIADYTKILTTKKTKHEEEYQQMAVLVAAAEAEVLELERDDGLEKKMRDAVHHLESVGKQKEQANQARKHRVEIKTKLELVEKETTDLKANVTAADEAVAKWRDTCSLARKEHSEAKAYHEQVASQKAHNDRVEAEKIVPGRLESQNLKKEKEMLAHNVSESSSKRECILKGLREAVEGKEVLIQKLASQVEKVSGENHYVSSALSHLGVARNALKEATDKECAENLELARNFTEAHDAEKVHQHDLETKLKSARQAKLAEARARSALERQQQEEWLEILHNGADILKELKAVEIETRQLEASHRLGE